MPVIPAPTTRTSTSAARSVTFGSPTVRRRSAGGASGGIVPIGLQSGASRDQKATVEMPSKTTYADVVAGVVAAIAAYAQALDDGRVDDVVATFCFDGSCDIPGLGAHAGHDALREAYEKV